MEVAIVAPSKFRDKYCNTGFQCAYADQILGCQDDEYYSWFGSRKTSGDKLILDLSHRVPRTYRWITSLTFYAEIARQLRPDYLTLPDVEFSVQKTVTISKQFHLQFLYKGDFIPRSVKPIGMLHGCTFQEIKECYTQLAPISSVIGLPASLEKVLPRVQVVKRLRVRKPVMFFGIFKDPFTEVSPNSNSLCLVTSLPLRLAYSGRLLSENRVSPAPLNFDIDKEPNPRIAESNVKQLLSLVGE